MKETKEIKEEKEVKAKKTSSKKETSKETSKKKEVKKTKQAKKEVKKEEKKRTEAHAKAISLKVTPRKVRLVIDLVRGKDVNEALEILHLTHKEAAPLVRKLIESAKANATNNFNMDEDKLYVASIMASDSIKMKRYLPRAKGSASNMVKRFSNVYVTLKERESL